ncbi:hypothetical protein CHLNCDRAFT_135426 [Chlorella variabilis]|uniref:Uncharacterized protein n=1 Tax=Chlorella variabilis TaxID=554065 RepID=E1ZI74_CHLVA|nr:hypothetical protein CHLNCDRAFT_135426 [Chlorella variabilis]EFN54727.1 hypothetical protein CHLNCDRAFT_135426 [Chlorella variabilis]|eukprot:XP_005846829.1 hypothetical protein CHLNCDRAFT_135426 [Chlorella variabilis]
MSAKDAGLIGPMRKQQELSAQLQELGEEGLEERLQSATQRPARPAHRLTQLVADVLPTGRPVLVLELSRGGDATATSEQLGELAARLVAAGADALAVKTDAEDTAEPLKDLLTVTQSALAASRRCVGAGLIAAEAAVPPPVLQRDWFIHPLQIANAKEAGAAGVIETIASVTSRGTPLMSSFSSAIGLDCPVEIELRALEPYQMPWFGLNLSVGLSVSITGFGLQVATGLLGEMPFGAISMVGARSIEEARQARAAGADCVLVKWELVQLYAPDRLGVLVEALQDATCGDD